MVSFWYKSPPTTHRFPKQVYHIRSSLSSWKKELLSRWKQTDSTHNSGISNRIGWAESVTEEHWAVLLSWPQRTSVMPRAGRSLPLVSHSQWGSQCFPLGWPEGSFYTYVCWKIPYYTFNAAHSATSVPAPPLRSGGAWPEWKSPPWWHQSIVAVECCSWENN